MTVQPTTIRSAHEHPAHRNIGAAVSSDDFRSLFRGHPSGVAVITATCSEGPVALTASSVASVSAGAALVYHNRSWHRLGEHSRVG
ncbi:hypothetical protein GCM10025773_22400 [Microbacterium jejuense]